MRLTNNLSENKYKYLDEALNKSMVNFVNDIKNNSSVVYDCNDVVFNFFIKVVEECLKENIRDSLYQFFSELNNNYNLFNNNKNDNNFLEKEEIKSIIDKTNILQIYKKEINNDIIKNYKKYIQNCDKTFIELENMSIILTGRSGVGKSTLINCLLKERVADTGAYNVVTMETKN